MSEYPWDFENNILAAHDQPCDCAICDEIHFQRLMRKKRRTDMNTNAVYGTMSVNEQLNREIDRLTAENERFKVMYKGFENQAVAIIKYRSALQQIVDVGNLDNNLPQDGRMYDIAKAALEI